MSLKTRLTITFTSIAGGVLLAAGIAIYLLVYASLLAQLDDRLERTWNTIRSVSRVSASGEFETIREISFESDILIQAWGVDGEFLGATFTANQLDRPLNPEALDLAAPHYNDVYVEGFHLRVLSVPVFVGERTIGTVQIGSSLEVVDRTLNTLFQALLILFVLATVLFWVLGWISAQRLLLPLEKAKDAALLITQTSDLARRIPASGIPGDEVDQLIDSFNQNISRLERLIETQRRFVADVGHELRTPLTVIKGNVGLMRRMKTYDEESLLGISEEVDRLARLVGDLILLAQAEAGKLPLERQDVELDTVLLDVFKQMSVLARQKKIKMQLGDVDQILVCGDRDRLTQVLVNLISNAIKYTPAGSRVETGMIIQAGMVGLTVADNGPGIPAEHLPHIFERFYRAEQARQRSPDGRGYGLGLSIAYWIVANHNGRIEVDSRVGEGTNFTVWLPLKQGDCAEAAPGQGLMPSA